MTTANLITHPPTRISPLAPAYYLGRPARVWMTAMNPRRRRKPAAGALSSTGKEQTLNPAHEPSQALAYRTPLPLGGDLSNSGIG